MAEVEAGSKNLRRLSECNIQFQMMLVESLSHSYFLRGGGGRGISESTDRRGCAILALEVVPKNLIFT